MKNINNIIHHILNVLKSHIKIVLKNINLLFLYKTYYITSYDIMSGHHFHTICDHKHYTLELKPKYIMYISYYKVDLLLRKY